MSAFSAVTHIHLPKPFLVSYARLLSTLTYAVNGPFGYIPKKASCSVGEPTATLLQL